VRCAGLVRDLENIQRDAAALPDLVPSRDLWEGIEARIAAPVIPLAARPERRRSFAPAWMGIAAAALVVSTAGITYMLTARSLEPRQSASIAQIDSPPTQTPPPVDNGSTPSNNSVATAPSQPDRSGSPSVPQRGGNSAQRGGMMVSRDLDYSDVVYGREIEKLQEIVRLRSSQLDSSTVAIIEKNLKIIDAAIAQSRAALAKDPASMLLSEQLTHALDKKVELLRTAALLPAST
jgi:hypothetical protein